MEASIVTQGSPGLRHLRISPDITGCYRFVLGANKAGPTSNVTVDLAVFWLLMQPLAEAVLRVERCHVSDGPTHCVP